MSADTFGAAQEATQRLGGKWLGSYGLANCPAHNDKRPSLSIQPGHTAVLFHCFAGCSQDAVLHAIRQRGIGGHGVARESTASTANPSGHGSRLRLALEIWDKARNIKGSPAEAYLRKRCIHGNGHARFDPKSVTVEDVDGERKRLTFPSLVLPIHDNQGFVGVQRVFLTEGGEKADLPSPKKILGSIGGGSIRLGAKPSSIVRLAEGFEDAQSAIQLHGLTHCWAVCGIERYGRVDLPEACNHVVIYSQHGKEAAQAIEKARPHLIRGGRDLDIILPPEGGDWNDALRRVEVEGV